MSTRTSSTLAGRHRLAQELRHRHALDRLGVLERQKETGLGAHIGGPVRHVLAVQQDGPGGHRVGRVPHERAGQRGLAGAVGAHERVDLAGPDGEVDATEDGTVLGRDVEVADLEQIHLAKSLPF
jgi:hypothetical protein